MKIDLNQVVTIDFETFWGPNYSLSSKELNTSEYIRHDLFKAHCCGIKIGKGKTKCYPAGKFEAELKKIDWSKHDLLAHNTAFDGAIAMWKYGIKPRRYLDTLSMTRGLHAEQSRAALGKIAEFYGIGSKHQTYLVNTYGVRDLPAKDLTTLMNGCTTDVDLCFGVFCKQIPVYPDDEIELIDMTIEMFTDPHLRVDMVRAKRALEYEMQMRLRAIALARVDEKVLRSADKFADALRDLGVEPPIKQGKNGWAYAFAQTDLDFLELLEHEDLRVIRLVEGRLAAKSTITETRALRLMRAGEFGQALPVLLNYSGAKTHRWSGGNKLNMQNLNRQEYDDVTGEPLPMTGELRKSIIAPPGHVIVVDDSAQIELRYNNWLAGNEEKLDIIRKYDAGKGPDPYCILAGEIYKRLVTKKDKNERFVGKVGELGLGYGMGAKKFQTTLAIGSMGPPVFLDAATCQAAVTTYRRVNKLIKDQWKEAERVLQAMAAGQSGVWGPMEYEPGTIWLPNGMGLHYPHLTAQFNAEGKLSGFKYLSHGAWKHIYGGLLVENVIQALARICVAGQMIEVRKYLRTLKLKKGEVARVASMSHDEIISIVPARYGAAADKKIQAIMRVPPAWSPDIPLNAEGGFAVNYSK